MSFIEVAVPYPLPSSLHYSIDPEVARQLAPGSVVQVPLGRRKTHAFVLGFSETTDIDPTKIKGIESVIAAEPMVDATMLKFLRWISDYYCYPLGEVFSAAVPKQYCQAEPPKRRKSKSTAMDFANAQVPTPKPELNAEQSAALDAILDPGDKRPVLLHGVTGSGKTEVYMRVLEKVLEQGKGAIILVPEIALTPQLLGRFSGRFPGAVAVLHSDLTPKERFEQWERLRTRQARIVVGARSAVFAPIADLGLIVVDEEHETSFKQEDSLRYHARDIAVVRALFCGAKTVLGSATPSMESYSNALNGKYRHVQLTRRVHQREMPTTTLVDVKNRDNWFSPTTPWLSRRLVNRIEATLKAGQQCLLYLNRLGYAHFLFCGDCGHTWRCKNCDVALTYYQHPPTLKCHYCNSTHQVAKTCELCNGINLDTMGVGTEQVEKELKKVLPTARIARLDRSVVKTRRDLEGVLTAINAREVDVVIGTQMIAKGHDFPGIALVGILLADSSLNMPDFRAHERTFQIITQVSGRAGRADTPGEVIIQTINPEHPVLIAAAEGKTEEFYRNELEARKRFGFPPYQRTAMLRFQHRQTKQVENFAYEMARFLQHVSKGKVQVLGPSEAPLARLKNYYRWHCLVKAESIGDLQSSLRKVRDYAASLKSTVQFGIDVDPMSAM